MLSKLVINYTKIRRRIKMLCLRPGFRSVGKRFIFDPYSRFTYQNIIVGNDVFIGEGAHFSATNSMITIGDKVMFGPNVTMMTGDHNTSVIGKYMKDISVKKPEDDQEIIIENDVWIGTGAIILKGVTIQEGSIVAAGALVKNDVDAHTIVAGVPAKLIKSRFSKNDLAKHRTLLKSKYASSITLILIILFSFLYSFDMSAKDIIVSPGPAAIQKAVKNAKPGDVIYLNSGLYFESVVIQNSNITIKATPGEKAIITSAYPEYYNHNIKWTKSEDRTHPRTKKKYSIYTAPYPRYATFKKSMRYISYAYVADEEDNLFFTYRDETSFKYQFAAQDEVRGVFFDKDKIYLATEMDPNTEPLYVSNRRIIELYQASNFILDGGPENAITLKNGGRYGIIINQLKGKTSEIKNLKIINCHSGIFVNQLLSGTLSVTGNVCVQQLEELPWNFQKYGMTKDMGIKSGDLAKIKSSEGLSVTHMETSAICVSANKDGKVMIDNNRIYGYFNGIVSTANDVEISNNIISDIRDDAIEIEGDTPNNIISGNDINCSFVGISLTPIRKGPVYIYNNRVTMNYSKIVWNQRYRTGEKTYKNVKTLKFTGLTETDVTSDVHLYNNVFFSIDDVLNIGSRSNPRFNPQSTSFYNNLFISNGKISSSYGKPSDGIIYEGNIFQSKTNVNQDGFIPKARQWKNTHVSNSKILKADLKSTVELPTHFPESKKLNSSKQVGAEKFK